MLGCISSFYLPDFASVSIPILCAFPPHFSRASFCRKSISDYYLKHFSARTWPALPPPCKSDAPVVFHRRAQSFDRERGPADGHSRQGPRPRHISHRVRSGRAHQLSAVEGRGHRPERLRFAGHQLTRLREDTLRPAVQGRGRDTLRYDVGARRHLLWLRRGQGRPAQQRPLDLAVASWLPSIVISTFVQVANLPTSRSRDRAPCGVP